MKMRTLAVATILVLGGCVSTLSDQRIKEETAGVLGVSADQVAIENRHQEMTNTYYVARTSTGLAYACIINGGNIMTFGMTNPATCNIKAH